MADRVGQQLDNYRLLRLLGAGGFGEVYLAEHIYRKNQVAIKILPQLAQDDLHRFLNEARTFRLKHPNIVQVLDFGVEVRTPFIVMEYAPNGTLRQRHPRGTRVPLPIIVSYVKQVASALQYAHDERLVHRDVKPENMLIGAQNQILLSDFGIATIAHGTSSQSVETMVGTIPYMAPEQIQAHPRPASDQYSLGVVVYEWLCGDRPFHGSFTEIAVKHTTVPPPPLHEKAPTIPPDVEQVVMTALAKDPRQRFGSVQAFAQALDVSSSAIRTKEQWLAEGVAHYDVGQYEAALVAYDQALRLDPEYAAAYHNRGMAYVALQQYDKAIDAYNRALQLAPENVTVYFNRGWVYHDLKQYDRAIADYDQVLRRYPEHSAAYRNRGHAYKELAIADYTQALTLDPNDVLSRVELEILKKHLLSRRAVIMGIGGAVGLAVASGGLTWLLFPRTLPPTHAAWYDSNFLYKKSITIDHTKVSGGSDLSNFPALISLKDSNLKIAANGGYVRNSNGYDIIFTDSTETTKLDHEIEKYEPTTGEIEMWVSIPTLSATTDTVIYMYFGNSRISSSQENETGVWDSNYQSVWHMGDNAANPTVKDSTNANNGTARQNTLNMTIAGKIEGALSFNGSSDYVSANTLTGLQGDNSRTVSIWIKTSTTTQQPFFYSGVASIGQQFGLALTKQDEVGFSTQAHTLPPTNTPGVYLSFYFDDVYIPGQMLTDNKWHYIVVTLSGTSVYLYIDGAKPPGYVWNGSSWSSSLISQPFTLPSTPNTTGNYIWIGHSTGAFWDMGSAYFNGGIDEVRISNTNRSSGWILTEYNNQSSPSKFYTVSPLVSR